MVSTVKQKPATLDKLSKSLRGFYVPQFEIKVEGVGLPQDVMRDVIELTYEDDLDKMDSFQITVSNWDEAAKKYKYIGSEPSSLSGADNNEKTENGSNKTVRYELFEPCSKKVQIKMGYLGDLKNMMTGFFTTMEPTFSPSAAATLNVRGINVLQRFRTKKYNDFFEKKTPSEIAELVGKRRDKGLKALRLPVKIVIEKSAKADETKLQHLAQRNEYSIDFLWKLARRQGYVVTMLEQKDAKSELQIRFGPSEQGKPSTEAMYELKLGQSLIDFKPRITTANQFKSVTVNGWDRSRQRMITGKASFDDKKMKRLNADLNYLLCMCDAREELVVDEPVFNKKQANERARALLLDQQKQMVKVSGTTIGLPLLKAGSKVHISNVGARLSGDYFITKTKHVFNDSGYITKFDARRETITEPEKTRSCKT